MTPQSSHRPAPSSPDVSIGAPCRCGYCGQELSVTQRDGETCVLCLEVINMIGVGAHA